MNKKVLMTTVAGMFATALAANTALAEGKTPANQERCYGIAKAGKNDCKSASASHSCAGLAPKDFADEDWVYVAKGQCEQSGGKLKPVRAENELE